MKTMQIKKLVLLPRAKLERYTRKHPEASVVWEGLIVKEFIEKHGIADTGLGMRRFYAFKREQVKKLGLRTAS
jgi:hypothetical protein